MSTLSKLLSIFKKKSHEKNKNVKEIQEIKVKSKNNNKLDKINNELLAKAIQEQLKKDKRHD